MDVLADYDDDDDEKRRITEYGETEDGETDDAETEDVEEMVEDEGLIYYH